ncbi:MAG: RNA 2',3'-cyclic phosphodiesterase [Gemmatimonadaceae bacterium]|nr:RNA 2',3'-cyclic phosphodiesterase [Gemmatimonadaceae bacterium]
MRLFVAINLPDGLRDLVDTIVAPARERLPSVRWVPAERFHLTLKFVGDCTAERAQELGVALHSVAAVSPRLSCTVGGAGVFPNFRRPRVVWLGVQQPLIVKIASELDRALGRLGIPVEARPYVPHLTVGRLDRDLRDAELAVLAGWARSVGHVGELPVRSVELMESAQERGGRAYTLVTQAHMGADHC